MAYEYEKDVISELEQMGVDYESNGYFNMSIEVEEVYRKAKAFDEIRKIENLCYYVEHDKYSDIDREGFETREFIKNTLKIMRDWERADDDH